MHYYSYWGNTVTLQCINIVLCIWAVWVWNLKYLKYKIWLSFISNFFKNQCTSYRLNVKPWIASCFSLENKIPSKVITFYFSSRSQRRQINFIPCVLITVVLEKEDSILRGLYIMSFLFFCFIGEMKYLCTGPGCSYKHTPLPPWHPAENSGIDASITPTNGLDQVSMHKCTFCLQSSLYA